MIQFIDLSVGMLKSAILFNQLEGQAIAIHYGIPVNEENLIVIRAHISNKKQMHAWEVAKSLTPTTARFYSMAEVGIIATKLAGTILIGHNWDAEAPLRAAAEQLYLDAEKKPA